MIETITKDPQDKLIREIGSATPKTDEQILRCFSKSKTLVRTWTVCFIVAAIFGVFIWLQLSKKLVLDKTTLYTVGGTLTGFSTFMGIALNIINILGLQSTCNCLKTCGDAKTIRFMYIVNKIKFWTLMDTAFIFIFPMKIFTTFMVKYHSAKLKPMLKTLKKEYKVY